MKHLISILRGFHIFAVCWKKSFSAKNQALKANLHWGVSRSSRAWFFVCFICAQELPCQAVHK